jgi:predicted GNAT superfamily acetyltransferase
MPIESPRTADEMADVIAVFDAVWGSATPVVTVEMLVAIAHGGGYVSLAREETAGLVRGRAVGASLGFLARHDGHPALHSHVTGLVPSVRGTGLGRAIKLHQREWAAANGLDQIVWTFDPLVRRNAWFNIGVLGAEVREYLPSFYGTMTDAINAGDDSDRLLVVWDVRRPVPAAPRDGADYIGARDLAVDLVPTPADVVELRRNDPSAVARWRSETRSALAPAIGAGRPIVGFTRAGEYVIGSAP